MMRQLLLLRHAKSAWDDPKLPDHSRPLNARGHQAGAAMRELVHTLGLMPDLVLVSSARRTLQTLQALGPLDPSCRVTPLDGLYLATLPQLLETIHGIDDTARRVMIIGHNPGLHELALTLAGGEAMARPDTDLVRLTEGFPTGALAAFALACPWSAVGRGSGRLDRFVAPRDLPEPAGRPT